MPRASIFLAAALASAHSVALAQRDVPLVGEWTGSTYVGGETGMTTLNFFPNGTYSRTSVTLTEYGWTLAGNTLFIAPAMERTSTSVTYGKASEIQVSFHGDSLTAAAGGQKMTLTRIWGPTGEGSIMGRWQTVTDQNEAIIQEFMADGTLRISVIKSREAGRYSVKNELIHFEQQIPLNTDKRWRFRLSNATLLLYVDPKLPPLELKKTDNPAAQIVY